MKHVLFLAFFLLSLTFPPCFTQENKVDVFDIQLYEKKDISSEETHTNDSTFGLLVRDVTNPTSKAYIPKNSTNKTAVIICPGGGYHTLLFEREGTEVAEAFNKHNIAAFVLK